MFLPDMLWKNNPRAIYRNLFGYSVICKLCALLDRLHDYEMTYVYTALQIERAVKQPTGEMEFIAAVFRILNF